MFHPQESSSSFTQTTCFSLQPSPSTSIPNPANVPNSSLYPLSLSSNPSLNLLGADPYSSLISYQPFNGGFQSQLPVYYNDPNSVSSRWVSKQVGPVRFPEPIVKPVIETPIPTSSVGYIPLSNTNYQHLANKIHKKFSKATKPSHAVRCEVCNIDCNSVDVYEKHLSGKKHLKTLQTKYAPSSASSQPITNATDEDLSTKKQKLIENGVGEDFVRICTACNVVCNSEIAFADHLSGKKHIAQVQKVSGGNAPPADPNKATASPPSPLKPKAPTEDLEAKKKKVVESGAPVNALRTCPLCNIVCNSVSVFNFHLAGKKHASMIQKLAQTKTMASTTTTTI